MKVWDYGEKIGIQIRSTDREPIKGSPFEFAASELRAPAALDQATARIEVAVLEHLTRADA